MTQHYQNAHPLVRGHALAAVFGCVITAFCFGNKTHSAQPQFGPVLVAPRSSTCIRGMPQPESSPQLSFMSIKKQGIRGAAVGNGAKIDITTCIFIDTGTNLELTSSLKPNLDRQKQPIIHGC